MLMRFTKKLLLLLSLGMLANHANAFTLSLDNGYFYGPGDVIYADTGLIGIKRFPDGQLTNIQLTGSLMGFIPFANNGAAEPNTIAEKQSTSGPVDGLLSDGTEINENIDNAVRLYISDSITGITEDLLLIAERSTERPDGAEPILPDEKGNLSFVANVVTDPGQPADIIRFKLVFTTGTREIPFSQKTLAGENGGVDKAGPLKSGRVIVGSLGDYDNDGYLDGQLVSSINFITTLVAAGNPVAQIRPWVSDIPIAPNQAIFLTLNNILQNYPYAFSRAQEQGDFLAIIDHLTHMDAGIEAVLGNFRAYAASPDFPQRPVFFNASSKVRVNLARVQRLIAKTTNEIDQLGLKGGPLSPDYAESIQLIGENIKVIMMTLQKVAITLAKFPGAPVPMPPAPPA